MSIKRIKKVPANCFLVGFKIFFLFGAEFCNDHFDFRVPVYFRIFPYILTIYIFWLKRSGNT